MYFLRRYSSGQRGLTVNQLALAFAGSNPARRTEYKIPKLILGYFIFSLATGVRHLRVSRLDSNTGRLQVSTNLPVDFAKLLRVKRGSFVT